MTNSAAEIHNLLDFWSRQEVKLVDYILTDVLHLTNNEILNCSFERCPNNGRLVTLEGRTLVSTPRPTLHFIANSDFTMLFKPSVSVKMPRNIFF